MIQEQVKNTVKEVMEKKGYPFFENGDYNLNLIGIRSGVQKPNSFDDWMVVIYKVLGVWQVKFFDITTDAGTYWLINPMSNGTAILKPDCYKSVYSIDKHQGKYDALCQRKGEVAVYRDSNRDQIYDFEEDTVEWGYFGINIHKSHSSGNLVDGKGVDKFSAGCQVFKSENEFNILMNLAEKSASKYGNSFTYSLLTYKDFE